MELRVFDTYDSLPYYPTLVGAWLSLVERTVRDREVGGSNPLAPTINPADLPPLSAILLHCDYWFVRHCAPSCLIVCDLGAEDRG